MVYIVELSYPHIKPVAWFYGYVACTVIGLRWGKFNPSSANVHPEMNTILREYLTHTCQDDEWTKGRILEAIRGKTGTTLKHAARKLFPSLFPRGRRARSLAVPDELKDVDVIFDPARIEEWRLRVKAIKQEITMMNENTTEVESTEVTETTQPAARAPRKAKVNFVLPAGVDPESITLDNYREVTGARYRMTKAQKEAGLSREEAFAESKALAVSQLGGN